MSGFFGALADVRGTGGGFFGHPPAKATPTMVNVIVFTSGIVDAGTIFDVTAPGVAPPVLPLNPLRPDATDFRQSSGGALVSGDTTQTVYTLIAVDFGIGLNLAIVGAGFNASDITVVDFVGADAVHYTLGAADFFNTQTDLGDPTLQFGLWEWFSVPVTAFADGVTTSVSITSSFLI